MRTPGRGGHLDHSPSRSPRTAARAADDAPLTPGDAEAVLGHLRGAGRILVAVSGGPDSTALLHLVAETVRTEGRPSVCIATVDHGLRQGSRDVAEAVMRQAGALGLDARLLAWEGRKPETGVQEAARRERYRLLLCLAREIGATHLLTGHTLDDQAETVLFRMARGSGPAGLVGMRGAIVKGGVIQHRPFLGIAKRRLIATCVQRGWPFLDDPANRDPRFARSRLRDLLPRLAAEGLDATTFARLAGRLSRDDEALSIAAARLSAAVAIENGPGRKRLGATVLFEAPDGIAIRVLDHALAGFARVGRPRLARLETLFGELRSAHLARQKLRRTLHGHVVTLRADGTIEIVPEAARKRGHAG